MIDFTNKKIVLFDGVCNLCNTSVQFVIKHNKKKNIQFASLQSEAGKAILQHYNLLDLNLNSFVFVQNGTIYLRSSAALKVAKHLNGAWPLLHCFIIVPQFIRDGVYKLIANNRYKWFGKKEQCYMPTPELKERFLN
jgi:predicted DCC family thiol-disulfide oxidoreductase YuxK